MEEQTVQDTTNTTKTNSNSAHNPGIEQGITNTSNPFDDPLDDFPPSNAAPENANGDVINPLNGSDEPLTARHKDSVDSQSHSFVTISPPNSPEKSYGNVLDSLEASTSSTDQPKSKLDNPDYIDRQKMLDLESSVDTRRETSPELEEGGQDIDLKVKITERSKHITKSDSFMSYKIITDSNRPSLFDQTHYEVWRRYKDFEWLRDILEKTHYTLIMPPLPGKQLSRFFDHKSDTFLDERQKALDKFLKRLAAHPYFSFDRHVKVFLTADADTLSSHMRENTGSSIKLFEMFSSSVKTATTYVMLKHPDPDYVHHAKYFSELNEKFGNIDRVASRLHTDREELANSMEDFSSAMIQWATHEPHLSHPLQRIATCIEACGSATKTLNLANAYSLLMSTREYQLFCASGVNAIRRRDGLQYVKERSGDERDKRKKVHDDAAATGKVSKLPKLADDMQKASLEADKALDDLSKANEMLRVDIEKWGQMKDREMCSLMKQVADNHISHHQKCLSEWETVLKLLKSQSSTSPEREATRGTNISPELNPEHRPNLLQPGSLLGKESPSSEHKEVPQPDKGGKELADNNSGLEKTDSLDDLFS